MLLFLEVTFFFKAPLLGEGRPFRAKLVSKLDYLTGGVVPPMSLMNGVRTCTLSLDCSGEADIMCFPPFCRELKL